MKGNLIMFLLELVELL